MTAIIYRNDVLTHLTMPEFIGDAFFRVREHFEIAEQKAAADLKIPTEPKGRFKLDGGKRTQDHFVIENLSYGLVATAHEATALMRTSFIEKGYLPKDFPLDITDMPLDALVKAMRRHNPDAIPKGYKPFVAWFQGEVLEAAGSVLEQAQTKLVDDIAENIKQGQQAYLKSLSETIPAVLELTTEHPGALYDTHYNRAIYSMLQEADKRAARFGLAVDDDAFQNILYTPAFYAAYNAAYKPFYERIEDNSAMEALIEETVQRGVGSFTLAKHPTLAVLHQAYPESKFNQDFHIHTAVMSNRIKLKAKEHNIQLDEQLLDSALYAVDSYRDYHMMALMKPSTGYRFDDADGFKAILDKAMGHGIITAAQAEQLEQRRVLDVAEGKPFGTWEEHTKAIVAHGLIKAVKPLPATPQAKAPGRYTGLSRIVEAARSKLAWLTGSKNDPRPNP